MHQCWTTIRENWWNLCESCDPQLVNMCFIIRKHGKKLRKCSIIPVFCCELYHITCDLLFIACLFCLWSRFKWYSNGSTWKYMFWCSVAQTCTWENPLFAHLMNCHSWSCGLVRKSCMSETPITLVYKDQKRKKWGRNDLGLSPDVRKFSSFVFI